MVESSPVEKDNKKEEYPTQVEASKNGARLAPAIDLRSTYSGAWFGFSHDWTYPQQCQYPHCAQQLAQSIAISGVLPRQHFQVRLVHSRTYIATYSYSLTRQATSPYF
jgi:hypothetical protein